MARNVVGGWRIWKPWPNGARVGVIALLASGTILIAPRVVKAQSGSTERILYIHTDHQGNPLLLTDSSQGVTRAQTVKPFGDVNITNSESPLTLRFMGQYADTEAGVHYNLFRTYQPSFGRYLQSDPANLTPGANVYIYAANRPNAFSDRTGLWMEALWNDPLRRAEIDPTRPPETYQEALRYYRGLNLEQLQCQLGIGQHGLEMSGRGPAHRYIYDPANPNQVIDMRHFLNFGSIVASEQFGFWFEVYQLNKDRHSAFNPQDFFSNALGSLFFDKYNPERDVAEQLGEFFETRAAGRNQLFSERVRRLDGMAWSGFNDYLIDLSRGPSGRPVN